MRVINFAGKTFIGPESWPEVTPRQFKQYLHWIVEANADPAGQFALLQQWFGIRYAHLRLMDDEQRTELLDKSLEFIGNAPNFWLLPHLRVGIRQFVGPGNGLEYLTFGEFIHAQAARDNYLATNDKTYLYQLTAALYRPKAQPWQTGGFGGRMPFEPVRFDNHILTMSNLPDAIHQGVLLNYLGCLSDFPNQFDALFAGSSAGEGGTWLDVGISLARTTSALGSFAELEKQNLFLVLTTLNAIKKEADKLKADLKNG